MTRRRPPQRVRFVEHYTLETGSDHDAVVARFHVRRLGQRTHVRIGSWNVGRGTVGDLLTVLGEVDVLACQEFGDRWDDLAPAARQAGWRVVRGFLPGSSSTPLLIHPSARILRVRTWLLLARQNIGPGAGPDRNKQKNLVAARVKLGRATFGVASTHVVPTQGRLRRRLAAVGMFRKIADRFRRRRIPWFVCMDANTTPDKPQLDALYAAGWTNNHREGGVLPTHGKRAIDYVWWKETR